MRYFLEVSYKGTNYSGFQIQKNANTIQAEIEKALNIILKKEVSLTGSSRTDTGVHALQNYFHFDFDTPLISLDTESDDTLLYNLNSILPEDIAIKKIIPVKENSNCRFDAIKREYKYYIYQTKNPFLIDRSYYFPYKLDIKKMIEAAEIIKEKKNFTSFSKKKTQLKSFECTIYESEWIFENESLVYHVIANRFLRGMVRALTSTMLNIGRGKLSLNEFISLIDAQDFAKANFAVPAHGLFLVSIQYPDKYFIQ